LLFAGTPAVLRTPRPFAGPWLVWAILFSLIPGGIPVAVAGRTPSIMYFDILMAFVLLLLLGKLALRSCRFSFEDRPVLTISFAYVVAQVVSLWFSQFDILKAILAIKVFLFGSLTYFISLAVLKTPRHVKRAVYGLVFFATTVSVVLLFYYFTEWGKEFTENAMGNKVLVSMGMAANNFLAAMIVFILPLSVGLVLSERGTRRFVFSATTGVTILGLALTMSRGALVSLLFGILITSPLLIRAGIRIKHIAIVGAILVCFTYAVPKQVVESFAKLGEQYDISRVRSLPSTFSSRWDMIQVGWEAFLDHPIVGIGPAASYDYNWMVLRKVGLGSHNFVVGQFAELGLLGGIPFMILVVLLVRRCYRLYAVSLNDEKDKYLGLALLAGIIITLVCGQFGDAFLVQAYVAVFWVFMAVVRAQSRLLLQRKRETVTKNGSIGLA
jgi:O-antigen ligase